MVNRKLPGCPKSEDSKEQQCIRSPFVAPDKNSMVEERIPGALEEVRGVVEYLPAFFGQERVQAFGPGL
ncbi:MAG: hypothetical protein EP344_06520 [Bacteroidetes bacterium]|nr:MAG: hypothetical protein EP344_06520 [Bacteroidota bacterium]